MTTTTTLPTEPDGRNPDPGTWTVKTTTAPEIVCPPWCMDSKQEHLDYLWDAEGFVIHSGPGDVHGWHLSVTQTPAGDVCPRDPEVTIFDGDDAVTPDEAEERALAILELVKAARAPLPTPRREGSE